MKVKFGLILDMDGVVVDNGEFHRKAWESFCGKYGLLERFRHGALTDAEVEKHAGEKEALYRELYRPHIRPMPGLIPFLEKAVREEMLIALATSGPRSNVDFVMDELGIRHLFDLAVDDSMVSRGKPHPDVFLKTASLLEISPHWCAVIEDSVHGLEAAVNAGMLPIALNHPDPREVEQLAVLAVPDFTSLDPSNIKEMIRNHRP